MAPRAEQLKAEIEQTKRDLQGHLSELKLEAASTQRKAMKVAGIVVAAYVGYRIAKFIWRRARS